MDGVARLGPLGTGLGGSHTCFRPEGRAIPSAAAECRGGLSDSAARTHLLWLAPTPEMPRGDLHEGVEALH